MDERTGSLKSDTPPPSNPEESPEQKAEQLDHDIKGIRNHLDGLVGELDRRRHNATDIRHQWAVHKNVIISIAAGITLVSAGAIALASWRQRARSTRLSRAHRLVKAVGRAIEDPDKVAAAAPSVANKVLGAVAATAATMLVRKAMGSWSTKSSELP